MLLEIVGPYHQISKEILKNFHEPLTQICICGAILNAAVSTSLINNSNLSHFTFKSHNYSIPLR